MKKLLIFIMTVFVGVGAVGFISQFVKNEKDNEAEKETLDRIVELTDENGTLNEKQVNLLSSGADITYDSDVYRLLKVGDENIYEHTDGENIFLTKYIGVDTEKRTFRTWEKLNNDVVTKALMNSALTEKDSALKETLKEYVTDDQITKILADYEKGADLTETLKKYVTEDQTRAIISNSLKYYITNADLSNRLSDYVSKDGLSPIIENYYIQKGVQLDIELHTMYFVQAFNDSGDLQELKIVGKGNRNGTTGKFAMVITGDSIDENLCILQTGSIVMSNLVVTDSRVTGVAPNGGFKLRVFKISGKGTK